jgi:hypothetical protein
MNPDDVDETEAAYLYQQWLEEQASPEPEIGLEEGDEIPF